MNQNIKWCVLVMLAPALIALCRPAHAAELIECRIDSSGEVMEEGFPSTVNPLSLQSIDLRNGFRFSGVNLEGAGKFKSYVFYESKERQVLIARQEFELQFQRCGVSLGTHEVYAPYLENHLTFSCQIKCAN
ncbi:MAG TPA: hypothetical protein VFV28_09465 [Limnobacter sp.]|nr:hypothetical protein [Limnobacter sp.]